MDHYDELGFSCDSSPNLSPSNESKVSLLDHVFLLDRSYRTSNRNLRRWNTYRHKRNNPSYIFNASPLKRLIRTGVPNDLRGEIWSRCLGSRDLLERLPSDYTQYVEQAETAAPAQTLHQIDLDITRTFPTHRLYQTPEGLQRLRRVLRAFAVYNPKISYCQALNFLAGLLLIFMDEDLAFWSLVQMISSKKAAVQGMDLEDYYTGQLLGVKRDTETLQYLMKQHTSKALALLRAENIELGWICSEWFLCFFSTTLPVRTTLRVWDTLMHEGQKVLFRVSLALFKQFEQRLPQPCTFETILDYFKKGLRKQTASPDILIHTAFYKLGTLKRTDIRRLQFRATDAVIEVSRIEELEKQQRRAQWKRQCDEKTRLESEKQETDQQSTGPTLQCVIHHLRLNNTETIPEYFKNDPDVKNSRHVAVTALEPLTTDVLPLMDVAGSHSDSPCFQLRRHIVETNFPVHFPVHSSSIVKECGYSNKDELRRKLCLETESGLEASCFVKKLFPVSTSEILLHLQEDGDPYHPSVENSEAQLCPTTEPRNSSTVLEDPQLDCIESSFSFVPTSSTDLHYPGEDTWLERTPFGCFLCH